MFIFRLEIGVRTELPKRCRFTSKKRRLKTVIWNHNLRTERREKRRERGAPLTLCPTRAIANATSLAAAAAEEERYAAENHEREQRALFLPSSVNFS